MKLKTACKCTLLTIFLIPLLILRGSYAMVDFWQYTQFVNRVEAINARIDYLHHEEGYSILAAKHITDVEFGITPADTEYNALIED